MRIFIFENGIDSPPKEYSKYLIYPYSYERCHDESLAAASVVLKNTPVELTFDPGTFVFVGDGDYKSENIDQWVLVQISRDTNHAVKRHTHTLYLCDPTKMLERYVLGNKTFTRSIVRELSKSRKIYPIVEVEDSGYIDIDSTDSNNPDSYEYCATVPYYSPSPSYGEYIEVEPFEDVFPNCKKYIAMPNSEFEALIRVESAGAVTEWRYYRDHNQSVAYSTLKYNGYDESVKTYAIDLTGDNTEELNALRGWVSTPWIAETPLVGTVKISYRFIDVQLRHRTATYVVYKYDSDAPAKYDNIALLQACQIVADTAQIGNTGPDLGKKNYQQFTVRAIGDIAAREMEQEITDIDISGATLREAINKIAGIANCFGRYRLLYNTLYRRFDHVIELHPIHSNEYADVAKLGHPVLQKMNDSIEGACSELDSTVSNLINMSEGGTISEPTDYAYISLRSETVRITEESCLIPTARPIYKFVGLKVIYEDSDTKYEADISQYVFEDTEYGMLSSFYPTYPYSKAYALKYTRGKQNITELSFVQENAISDLLERASIVNICNAEFETNFSGLGIKNGMLKYPNLSFRITYIPVTEARVRQAKPFVADHFQSNIICYNQSAQSVDTVRYGRNMAGMVDRTGQAEKALVYKVSKRVPIPQAGRKYDDEYVIAKVSVQELPQYNTIQLDLSRYFNRLNPFIGLDSELRLFEISENGYVDRHVIYEDYCVISDQIYNAEIAGRARPGDPLITSTGLARFSESLVGIAANGSIPQLAIVQGTSSIDGKLNAVALPVSAYGLGRSMVFAFGYQDNYSAGDRSVHTGEYGDIYRLKEAVPYSDAFGEIESLSVELVSRVGTDALNPDELPLATAGIDYISFFSTNAGDCDKKLMIYKDSRECIHVSYQIHFVTDKNWIISPAFAEDMKMVTRRSSAVSIHVYVLEYRLGASDTRIDLTRAVRQLYTTDIGALNLCLQVNEDKIAVEQNQKVFGEYAAQNKFSASGQAWAVAYDDGRLMFGNNQDIIAGSTALPNINFTFTHKL